MRFKIIFPTGYQVADIFNDNIDINVVLENGDVFFGALFTISNLDYLLTESHEPFFYASDLLIVKDLSKKNIRAAIESLVSGSIELAFTKIRSTCSNESGSDSFDTIIDMC